MIKKEATADYTYTLKQDLICNAPVLKFENEAVDKLIGSAYGNALINLISINTIECNPQIYNNTGLIKYPPGLMIRAGGDYQTPWTRDAAINSWSAASILEPEIARNTLFAVCNKDENGYMLIQQDNQWWDKVIWVTAAWSQYLITGNKDFLKLAYEISSVSLNEMFKARYNPEFGMFEGPSFFNDGIAGYPGRLHQPGNTSSFVLDHPDAVRIIALSTNCVYYNAYACAAKMASELNEPVDRISFCSDFAEAIKKNINTYLWNAEKNTYGYFIYTQGQEKGKLDMHQEGMGISFSIIFEIADREKTENILKNAHMQSKGMVDVWPHFADMFSDEKPGRHNCITWPLINGFWARAAAFGNRADILRVELENVASLVEGGNGEFYEIYNSIDGSVSGGWQSGQLWDSCRNQTWSATSYIGAIMYGLFGMIFEADGLRILPCVPEGWEGIVLRSFKYRDMTLNISLVGTGNKIKNLTLNGIVCKDSFVPSQLSGEQSIRIELEK